MKISERIFEIMDKKQIKPSELAKKTEIRQSTISDWKTKGSDPQARYIERISEALEVSIEYLLTGKEGEAITESDARILRLYKATTGERREYIDTMLTKTESELTQAESNDKAKEEAI